VFVLLAISLGLVIACHQSAYSHVLPCQSIKQSAQHEYIEGRLQSALDLMQRAVEADPLSADAHAFLADICLQTWLGNHDSAYYDAFETHDDLARRLAPKSAPVWRASAVRYQQAFAKTDAQGKRLQPRAIDKAVVIARRTTELYPGSANDRAALALIYQLSGDEAAYRREAQAALELDRVMPHEDKKLPEALRQKLETAVQAK
jgi:hypothetical protein